MTDRIVRIETDDSSASVGDTLTLNVIYESDDSTLPGLGLQLHFDSTELQFESVQNVLATSLIPAGGTPVADTDDNDGDLETDTFIAEGWLSFEDDWPGQEQVTLYTIEFTVLEGFDGATINFTENENSSIPDVNFLPQSFTITLDGGSGNNAPTAENDTADTNEDTPITITVDNRILANDSDPDTGDTLSITQLNGAAFTDGANITLDSGATLTLNADGSYVYNPNGAFEDLNDGDPDTDTFTYTISDGTDSATATVTINITGVTDNAGAPTAENDTNTTAEDTILTVPVAEGILTNDTDPNDDTLSITAVNGGDFTFDQPLTLDSGAILTLDAEGGYIYNPNGAFDSLSGGQTDTDNFSYTISDGTSTDTATVTIEITGVGESAFNLDVDGNNNVDPFKDGLLIFNHLLGLSSSALSSLIDPEGQRSTVDAVDDWLDQNESFLDVDKDPSGNVDPFKDGLLVFNHLLGLSSSSLSSLIDPEGDRGTVAAVDSYLDSLDIS